MATDQPNSSQKQSNIIPASHKDILESTGMANVATIGPKGEPQVNPVWFSWDGQNLRFSQTQNRQKLRNISRDPRIAISILDPNNPYRYLEIRGVVSRIEDDANNQFIDSLTKKYIDQKNYPWHQPGDHRVTVVVEPQHTTTFG